MLIKNETLVSFKFSTNFRLKRMNYYDLNQLIKLFYVTNDTKNTINFFE